MIHVLLPRRFLLALVGGVFAFSLPVFSATIPAPDTTTAAPRKKTGSDRTFVTPKPLATEAITLVKILEEAHYNRDAVRHTDYASAIPDFMEDLDQQHMFFLASDKAAFTEKYGKTLYYNTALLGNLDVAYEVFEAFETRANARIDWIFEELKGEIDLKTNDSFHAERSKANWPEDERVADDLWRKRLKFEILAEVLNKKSLEDAKQVVRKRYERWRKTNAEIETHEIAELFLGTVARLYDPHSTYYSAESFENFGINMKLWLFGIGALLGVEEDVCIVKEIVPGGPADLGNELKPNDKIISVAQAGQEPVELIGMKLQKIVEMIRGEKGTDVHLVVHPAAATDPSARKEIVITRDLVKLNSARAHAAIFEVPGADGKNEPLGVISLPAFYNSADNTEPDAERVSASKDVARLVEQLKQAGVKGMVLDLRHNGGGYLTEAIELAGLFIKSGPVVQVKNYDGVIQVDEDPDKQLVYDGPLAVLVDRFSASASEIVAGALQNYGRAIVVGDSSTHGKGSVQQVVEMKQISGALRAAVDEKTKLPLKTGAAKFTIQKYYLPSGDSTQNKGVVPDIVLPSIDEYIPNIGESSLPHALMWDKIPSSFFDGAPLEPKIVTPLRQASLDRQNKLEEFAYLKKNVEWFKNRQEQKSISLNLDERKNQKAIDDAFRKTMKAEREIIGKTSYPYTEIRLAPKAPPRIKAKKPDADEDEDELSVDEDESYPKSDVHLRETLRVVSDAIALGKNQELWVSNRAPLTVSKKD